MTALYEADPPRDDHPPAGYKTAVEELSDALEGVAPHLSRVVGDKLDELQTHELADAVKRAVYAACRRHDHRVQEALDHAGDAYRRAFQERYGLVSRLD